MNYVLFFIAHLLNQNIMVNSHTTSFISCMENDV